MCSFFVLIAIVVGFSAILALALNFQWGRGGMVNFGLAGLYALYSGFAVIGISAVVFAPIVHRMFHKLHIADTDKNPKP